MYYADVLELLAIFGSFAAFPACFVLARWLERFLPAPPKLNEPFYVGGIEPCWTEAIVSDGRFNYARRECINDVLMELDARAQRGDPPFIPMG
jgi:hypothetical protein